MIPAPLEQQATVLFVHGMPMLRLHRTSLFIAIALLAIEVLIALFMRDRFVRPYLGDVLVVMLIFFALRALHPFRPVPLALGTFVFAVAVEVLQAWDLIGRLGWSSSTMAKLVLGNTFQWGDLVCYATGCAASIVLARHLDKGARPIRPA